MKLRVNTKFGMATKSRSGDMWKLVFDRSVALNEHLSANVWLVSEAKLASIYA